jgi:hypothetical protein
MVKRDWAGRFDATVSRTRSSPNAIGCLTNFGRERCPRHEGKLEMQKLVPVLIAAAFFVSAAPARSAEYRKVSQDTIAITGPIDAGDETKFREAVSQIKRADLKQAGVILLANTPGGNIYAARQIAIGIAAAQSKGFTSTMVVRAGSVCASACVLMFAAATNRIVEVGGTQGGQRIPSGALYVHRLVIDGGNETEATKVESVALAQIMKEIGTPDAVLAKLLVTGSRKGARLDASDLRAWKNTTLIPFQGGQTLFVGKGG